MVCTCVGHLVFRESFFPPRQLESNSNRTTNYFMIKHLKFAWGELVTREKFAGKKLKKIFI